MHCFSENVLMMFISLDRGNVGVRLTFAFDIKSRFICNRFVDYHIPINLRSENVSELVFNNHSSEDYC
jgi:hypothetical protein